MSHKADDYLSVVICFNPVSLPISFTLDLRGVVRELSESSPLREYFRARARENAN